MDDMDYVTKHVEMERSLLRSERSSDGRCYTCGMRIVLCECNLDPPNPPEPPPGDGDGAEGDGTAPF